MKSTEYGDSGIILIFITYQQRLDGWQTFVLGIQYIIYRENSSCSINHNYIDARQNDALHVLYSCRKQDEYVNINNKRSE